MRTLSCDLVSVTRLGEKSHLGGFWTPWLGKKIDGGKGDLGGILKIFWGDLGENGTIWGDLGEMVQFE